MTAHSEWCQDPKCPEHRAGDEIANQPQPQPAGLPKVGEVVDLLGVPVTGVDAKAFVAGGEIYGARSENQRPGSCSRYWAFFSARISDRFAIDSSQVMSRVVLFLLFAVCAFVPTCCEAAPAHAGEAFAASVGTQTPDGPPAVTAGLICLTQHVIRWREAAWTTAECQSRARDFRDAGQRWGFAPEQLLAMSIAESDMRVRAQRVDGNALDEGLMGVRCVLGRDAPNMRSGLFVKLTHLATRCTNYPVRGLTTKQLLEPHRNIEAGARILADLHHGDLASYNSGHPGGARYPTKVAAIISALGGVEVRVCGVRFRMLVRKIVAAVQKEKRS
jgi:hypothetical protein